MFKKIHHCLVWLKPVIRCTSDCCMQLVPATPFYNVVPLGTPITMTIDVLPCGPSNVTPRYEHYFWIFFTHLCFSVEQSFLNVIFEGCMIAVVEQEHNKSQKRGSTVNSIINRKIEPILNSSSLKMLRS